MKKLAGKVAVVTGGARDIGRAISLKLAEDGAKVVLNYFDNEGDADETIKLIEAAGSTAIKVQGDMTNLADVERLGAAAKDTYGKVDILVNVAGGLVARKTIGEQDEAFYDFLMNLNFKSVWLTTKVMKPLMGSGGSIINFASQAGRDGGGPGASLYATAKGAVMTFTRSMAKEFGPDNIRVNSLCPGVISTTFHDTFTKDEVRAKIPGMTPLRREGRPQEVADLVSYLASDDSSFLTGTNIDINGGLLFS